MGLGGTFPAEEELKAVNQGGHKVGAVGSWWIVSADGASRCVDNDPRWSE